MLSTDFPRGAPSYSHLPIRGIPLAPAGLLMRRTALLLLMFGHGLAVSAAAQTGIRAPRGLNVGVLGGVAAYSDFQRGSVLVSRPTADGIEERELARRVGAKTSTAMSAYISFWPSPNWGLRVQGAWAPTRFETLMKESEAEFAGMPRSSDDAARLAGLDVLSADLQVLFRLPTIRNRIMPYGILGGGVTQYRVTGGEPLPEEAEEEFQEGDRVRPAGVFGLGAMLPLSNRAFRMHFELTNHLTSTPVNGGSAQALETTDATILFAPAAQPPGETRVKLTSTVRFVVGLSYSPRQ